MVYLTSDFNFWAHADHVRLVFQLTLRNHFGSLEFFGAFRPYFENRTETAFRDVVYELEVV